MTMYVCQVLPALVIGIVGVAIGFGLAVVIYADRITKKNGNRKK